MAGERTHWRDLEEMRDLTARLHTSVDLIAGHQEKLLEFRGQLFVGTWRTVEDQGRKAQAFTGLSTDQLKQVAHTLTTKTGTAPETTIPRFQEAAIFQSTEEQILSLFSMVACCSRTTQKHEHLDRARRFRNTTTSAAPIVEMRRSLRKSHLQKRLQPVPAWFRNGLYLTETKSRGERIRTSGLLVPKHVRRLVESWENAGILDAFD